MYLRCVCSMGSFPSRKTQIIIKNTKLKHMVSMSDEVDISHVFSVKQSWDFINFDEKHNRMISTKTNLVFFFDYFYESLLEKENIFRFFFKTLKFKSLVLMSLMNFVSTIDISDMNALNKKFQKLSLLHQKHNIQIWMFVVFKRTMIESVMACFGTFFDQNVINSWYIVIRFCTDNIISRYNTSHSFLLNRINGSLKMSEF